MRKLAIIVLLALCLPRLTAQEDFIEISPGAICRVWQVSESYNPRPLTIPKLPMKGYFIDQSDSFSRKNMLVSKELAPLASARVFRAWSGYVRIAQPGQYNFSVSAKEGTANPNVMLSINDKTVLEVSHDGNTLSPRINLGAGMARIGVFLYCPPDVHGVSLQYKKAGGVETFRLTPEFIFHQP